MNKLWSSLKLLLWMIVITGIAYPLLITLIAQVFLHHKANGSFVTFQKRTVGSSLIAQKFQGNQYFWPRPSAHDYNALISGGSNLGPTSAVLKAVVEERKNTLGGDNIPSELLYASGSGLDPHISPAAAYFQVNRVAQARGLNPQQVKALVDQHIHFGCVNVLLLNLDLEKMNP